MTVRSHTVVTASESPFSPSQTTMHTSATPRFLISVSTDSQNLAPHRPRRPTIPGCRAHRRRSPPRPHRSAGWPPARRAAPSLYAAPKSFSPNASRTPAASSSPHASWTLNRLSPRRWRIACEGAEKPGRLPVVPAPMGQRREALEHVRNSQKRGCEASVFDHLSIFHISGLALPIGGR